jgi:integrase/recombinase XerC
MSSRSAVAPSNASALAVDSLRKSDLTDQTVARLSVLMCQFADFVEHGHDLVALNTITPQVIEKFIAAPTAEFALPGPSLRYFRRLAVRQLFRACRDAGYDVGDPTVDVVLPSRRRAAFRPLEDDEVTLCRAASLGATTRPSAAWALCEATARTAELAALNIGDVDLDGARVWLHGSPRLDERWGYLTEWGNVQLRRHINELPQSADTLLIDAGRPGTSLAQSSAVGVIGRTMRRCGLAGDPAVRPSSIAAWAGRKILEDTREISIVARRVGMRSLDRAAIFVGWDWRQDDV